MRAALLAMLTAAIIALHPTPPSALLRPVHHQRTRNAILQDRYGQDEYYAPDQLYTQAEEHDYQDEYRQQGQDDQYGYVRDQPITPVEWYFVGLDGQQKGPVTAEQMSRLYDSGQVGPDTYIYSPQKQPEWLPVSQSTIRYKHGRYDPRSTTQTYEQWLEASMPPRGWPQNI